MVMVRRVTRVLPLEVGARGGKKLENVPAGTMDEVSARLAAIFE
jgi:hypothetical protein